MPGPKIKKWKRLLANDDNRTRLISYLYDRWKQGKSGQTWWYSVICYYREEMLQNPKGLNEGSFWARQMLQDQKGLGEGSFWAGLLLHSKHAATSGNGKVIIISEDTDVLVLYSGIHFEFTNSIFLRRGKQNSIRIIDVGRLGTLLGKDVCFALIGLHAWAGCDTVIAFAGQGKVKAFNLIRRYEYFREASMRLGQE